VSPFIIMLITGIETSGGHVPQQFESEMQLFPHFLLKVTILRIYLKDTFYVMLKKIQNSIPA